MALRLSQHLVMAIRVFPRKGSKMLIKNPLINGWYNKSHQETGSLASFTQIFIKTAKVKVQRKIICCIYLLEFIYQRVDNLFVNNLSLKQSIQFILELLASLERSNRLLYPTVADFTVTRGAVMLYNMECSRE